jgi:folate-binding protein YgfZ
MARPDMARMETPLILQHRDAHVRLGEFSGCVLPEGFSEFDGEYRAAKESVALFDTNWSAVVTLAGPDRVRYLNAILSNDIQSLEEGRGALALLLNPQGHILAELEVYKQADKLLTLSHASVREHTVATLDKFIIMDDVELADRTDEIGGLAVEGPRAPQIVKQSCGIALDALPEMAICDLDVYGIPCHVLRRSHFGLPGAQIITKRERLGDLWGQFLEGTHKFQGEPIGMTALNSLRLEAAIPWFPVDFNDTVIPHEAALEATHISFTKGCYTGQEIVERVRSQGRVNRRRVRLKFSSAQPPVFGTRLRAEDVEVGLLTSAAYSPAAATAIGMGYLRREHYAPGSRVSYDGETAEVVA